MPFCVAIECGSLQRLEVARATGDMYSELCTLCNLGNCLRAKGSLNQALQHYLMVRERVGERDDIEMFPLRYRTWNWHRVLGIGKWSSWFSITWGSLTSC